MKISLNSIQDMCRRYGCVDYIAPKGTEELIKKIGAQLGEVEEVEYLKDKYAHVVVVKIVSCEDHPNADRLHFCTIDDGGITPNVKRNSDNLVEVVCGAPNVHAGMLAVWLPPGSTVPDSVGKEPFVLESREIRGKVSNGMLASPKELDLGDNHDGILEIESSADVKPGDLFGDKIGLTDDVIIDIENKMFTHRPDCFGILGVARELAGIQNLPFKSPGWYQLDSKVHSTEADELPLTFRNEVPSLAPRFLLQPMSGVKVETSPVWLQVELAKHGVRSINNIVDLTNFIMLETAQPLHAYDYDKVKALSNGNGAVIEVRLPHENEKIKLLNGKEIDPRQEAIMIATDKALIGLAGVMGGADTEVDENTANIILEVGSFDMYSVRRTSMEHGIFTDALTRFSKGQSPLQNLAVMARIVDEISKLTGAKVAGPLIDDNHVEGRSWVHPPVPITPEFINARLGLKLSAKDIQNLLQNVEFSIDIDNDKLTVSAPFWRTDIETREDVVEEVGRLHGYDKLPLELLTRSIRPVTKDPTFELKNLVRTKLASLGANELLTYSFVHGNLLDKVGQDKAHAFRLSNASSPDLQYYRLSLLPSLLDKVHPNIKAGYNEFTLFELGKSHLVDQADEDGLPKEDELLALVVAKAEKLKKPGSAYYTAQRYLRLLLPVKLTFSPVPENMQVFDITRPFDMRRSAFVHHGDLFLGIIGEFRPTVTKNLKLPKFCAGFELDILAIEKLLDKQTYIPISKFPKVFQDITLKVDAKLSFGEVFDLLEAELAKLRPEATTASFSPLGIYQEDENSATKNLTFRLEIASYQKTLRDTEVSALLDKLSEVASNKLKAVRI